MLPETVELLRSRGFLRGEDQVDRDALAVACLGLLTERPVQMKDEIQERAQIVPDLRFKLFGDAGEEVERELNAILGPLTGPKGHVQTKLENGYVLCSAPVSRKLSNNGEGTITLTRQGRFVTTSSDLIEEFFWQPAYERIMATVNGLNARFELGIRRQPQLAARKQPMVGKVHEQLAIEMPRNAQS
jgi:hypothetical protein